MRPTAIVMVSLFEGEQHRSDLLGELRLTHRDGVAERARLAPQQWQVMPEVADRLAESVSAAVPRDAPCRRPHLDVLRIRAQPEAPTGVLHRHRIPSVLEGDQCLQRRLHRVPSAGQEGLRRQRRQQRPFCAKALAHGLLLTSPAPTFLRGSAHRQDRVELVDAAHLGQRHQVRPAHVAHQVLHLALLVPLPRGAVVSAEAERALQRHELLARQELAVDQSSELARVVVPDRGRCPAPRGEGVHVSVEPGGTVLPRVRHDHVACRVRQPRAEQLHRLLHTRDPPPRFTEVDLRFRAGVVRQGNRDRGECRPAVLTNPLPHRGLAPGEAVLVAQLLPDPVRGVPLFGRPRLILLQPVQDYRRHGIHHRATPRPLLSVSPRSLVC
jgi:hypothetical protein